jgi:hypothetical protein
VEYLSNDESPATCKTSELLHYTNTNPTCTSLPLRNRLKIIGRVIICFGAISYRQWDRLVCTPFLSSPTSSHEHQHGDFPLSSDRRFYILIKKHRVQKMIGSQRSCKNNGSCDQVSVSRHVPRVTRVRVGDALDLAPRKRIDFGTDI